MARRRTQTRILVLGLSAAVVAAAGGNVVAVEHRRTAEDLGIGDVDIHLEIEAKGPAHRTTVLEALAAQVGDVLPDASDARSR